MRKPDPLALSRSATPPFAGHRLLKKSSPHVFKQFDPSTTLPLIPSLLLLNRDEACAHRAGRNSLFLLASKRCFSGGTELPVWLLSKTSTASRITKACPGRETLGSNLLHPVVSG